MARVAIFVEDRLVQDSSQRVLTMNRRLAGRVWHNLGPQGHDMVLCARLKPSQIAEESHEVDGCVEGLPYFRGMGNAIFKVPGVFMRSLLVAWRADLVVAKCPGLVGTIAVLAAKISRTPLAVHFVGDVEDSVSDSRNIRQRGLVKWLAKRASQWAVSQADAVRYPTRAFLQRKYPAAEPAREYWYTDASVIAVHEVPNKPSFVFGRIVAIGTQERMYKGHDFLIRAMSTVRDRVPGAHLVLVGKGACREELARLVRDLGLDKAVQFVDFLDGWSEVSNMIRSTHVFAMPSMAEGLPRALLEAMSLGTACVGSDASGIPELLPEYLLVPRGTVKPLAEILIKLMTNDAFRLTAAKDCLENSRPFTAGALQSNMAAWQQQLQELIVS